MLVLEVTSDCLSELLKREENFVDDVLFPSAIELIHDMTAQNLSC